MVARAMLWKSQDGWNGRLRRGSFSMGFFSRDVEKRQTQLMTLEF